VIAVVKHGSGSNMNGGTRPKGASTIENDTKTVRRKRIMGVLPMNRAEQLIHQWHGNGGRRSLYSLCKELDIDVNLAYVMLTGDPDTVLKKAKQGKKFHYYKPGMDSKFKKIR
jgi:hypothetical protein